MSSLVLSGINDTILSSGSEVAPLSTNPACEMSRYVLHVGRHTAIRFGPWPRRDAMICSIPGIAAIGGRRDVSANDADHITQTEFDERMAAIDKAVQEVRDEDTTDPARGLPRRDPRSGSCACGAPLEAVR